MLGTTPRSIARLHDDCLAHMCNNSSRQCPEQSSTPWAVLADIINGVLGAFTTTFETFCIPTLAFNWAYWKKENRDMCPKPPLR